MTTQQQPQCENDELSLDQMKVVTGGGRSTPSLQGSTLNPIVDLNASKTTDRAPLKLDDEFDTTWE